MNNDQLHLVRNQVTPALAYPASDVSSLWPCILKVTYVQLGGKLAVPLEPDVAIQGVDDRQRTILRFEGHNLVPSKGSLGPLDAATTAKLPTAMITCLARGGGLQLCVLSLVSRTPCAVWQPRALSAEASGIDKLPSEISALARTTTVCIVFDKQWPSKDNFNYLHCAVNGPQQCSTLGSSARLAQSHQQALWSFHDVAEIAKNETSAPPGFEDAQDDAPPAYGSSKPIDGLNKRSEYFNLVSRGYH